MKKFLSKYSVTIHKWLGLVIGIQIVLWVAGGLVMSWFDIEQVRGEHNIRTQTPPPFTAADNILPAGDFLANAGIAASEIKLKRLGDAAVYEVMGEGGQPNLFDAATGAPLSPLPAEAAMDLALRDFSGPGAAPSAPQWLEAHNVEYRAELPVWRIDMNDAEDTHLYVSPATGRVVARRNAVWRVYDFFWMLHIMDYENRTDFNHPLIIWASIFAVILSVTGVVLLFFRMKRKDFRFLGVKG